MGKTFISIKTIKIKINKTKTKRKSLGCNFITLLKTVQRYFAINVADKLYYDNHQK